VGCLHATPYSNVPITSEMHCIRSRNLLSGTSSRSGVGVRRFTFLSCQANGLPSMTFLIAVGFIKCFRDGSQIGATITLYCFIIYNTVFAVAEINDKLVH
jgi:hypothetical protein